MFAESRLSSLKKLLGQMRDRLGLDVGFILWDGSTIPDGLAPGALALHVADEGAVAALIRRPKLNTLLNLWVTGRLDLRDGTLFDIVARRPKMHTKEFLRVLEKRLVLGVVAKFLFVSRGGPWPLDELSSDKRNSGDPEENRRNISYHYDISNAFYELWLDKEMVYSCAYCTDWNNDIDQMQQDKLEMICRKLRLKPGERMLDIGCGWGAMAIYAATHYGVTSCGVTLSEQQVAYGQAKVRRLSLENLVKIELKDYSLVEGEKIFDKVVSIGTHEHIGPDNNAKYFETVKRLLKPGGLFLHHAITWPGKQKHYNFRRRRTEGKLFNKYIFPGGDLDYIGNTVTMLERHGFEVHDIENWREHYQRTCRHWHDRLLKNYDAAVAQIGETKTRLWLAYLSMSSIMFERNVFNLHQTLASPRRRGPSGLPPTRADLYR